MAPADFGHEAHVRLAYVYLCQDPPDAATQRMRAALLAFLGHLGIGDAKFHETLTGAWVDAVHHFMSRTDLCADFREFIERNPVLSDSKIMLSHYSAEVLFSDAARKSYLDPDLEPIPKPPR
ncbi:MAG: hypothetical protein KC729_11615 [Candidatus Eisenbacteria bacterium]|uniref:Uncharacterized protein n=1 Tax=Eiseniibacteriota bacterium TaxID=2212470 RepID=A0A956RR81_UNCEI|nr:hypothetical protein [Candidatus Eisenbacteria bacterium]